MSERPTLSLSISRRPSIRASISGATSPGLIPSPLSSHPPITPQNAHFWDSYFPAPGGGVVGLQTPPLNAQPSLYPTAGAFPGRKGLLRRNSSLSSVSSSVMEDEDDEPEWAHDEEEQVQRIYDACLAKHALTEAPFPPNGPPPSNFTNMVARAVLRAAGGSGRAAAARKARFTLGANEGQGCDGAPNEDANGKKWLHSLKSTRLKILALVKERQSGPRVEDTPRQVDPDATPKRRQPLARQDSMDFLPDVHNTTSIARLSNMLRQPSQDVIPVPPPSTSRFPPEARLGALGVPLARSASSRPSYRMQRTNSLQSIAGSPSQPAKPRRKASAAADQADASLLAVPTSKAPGGSTRMVRTGSESSVLPARPLARHLSFSLSGATSDVLERAPLGTSPVKKARAPSAGLLTPPASSKKRTQAFTFASPPKNPLGLTLDSASTALKRDGGAAGLASAFSSPVVGVFPSPTSASPKKKKAKVTPAPVRTPSFEAPQSEAEGVAGLGLGLGIGIDGLSALSAEASSSLFSSSAEDDSPFLVRCAAAAPDREERMRTPSFDGPLGTFTLLDPSSSPTSLASRRNSPPKLTLTPSLSPTFSSTSMSSFSSTSSLATTAGTVSSPLSPLFDLNTLKLESLTTSPVESVGGMSDDSDEDFGCDGGSNAFLNPDYVRAGHEAQALRERLGSFAWGNA